MRKPSIPHYALRGDRVGARDRNTVEGKPSPNHGSRHLRSTSLVTHDLAITHLLSQLGFYGTLLVHFEQLYITKEYVCRGLKGECRNCQWPECPWDLFEEH